MVTVETRGELRQHAAVLLLFVGLTLAYTHPLALHLTEAIRDPWDALHLSWVLATMGNQLVHAPRHPFDGNAFHPFPASLTLSECAPLDGLLAWPVVAATGEAAAGFNVLLLAAFTLTGFTTYLLVREVAGSGAAGVIAGILHAFSPIRAGQLAHVHLLTFWWAPLALLALHRARRDPGARQLVLAAVYLGLQWATSITTGALLLVAFALAALVEGLRRRVKRAAAIAVAAATALLILAPLLLPYLRLGSQGFTRTLEENRRYSARLTDYLAAPEESLLWGARLASLARETSRERHLFPGALALLLAATAAGVAVRRRGLPGSGTPALLLATSVLLSLGPRRLAIGDASSIPLPYLWLHELVPGVRGMRVPARFALLAALALAVLAGLGAAELLAAALRRGGAPLQRALLGVLVLLAAADVAIAPGSLTSAAVPRPAEQGVYRWLREAPPSTVVVELPMRPASGPPLAFAYLHASTYHGKRLVNGIGSFAPRGYDSVEEVMASFPDARSLALCRALGAGVVLWHADHEQQRDREARRDRLLACADLSLVAQDRDLHAFVMSARALKMLEGSLSALAIALPVSAAPRPSMSLQIDVVHRGARPVVLYPGPPAGLAATWLDGASTTSPHALPAIVMPGSREPACIALPPPPEPGVATIDIELTGRDGQPSLHRGAILVGPRVPTSAHPSRLLVDVTDAVLPAGASPDQELTVRARVKNVGNTVWLSSPAGAPGTVALGVEYWVDERGARVRSEGSWAPLACDLAPGQEATLAAVVRAPREPGHYRARIGMVAQGLEWFHDDGAGPWPVDVHD